MRHGIGSHREGDVLERRIDEARGVCRESKHVEVMTFGAESAIVDDQQEERQPQLYRRVELSDAHHQSTVTQRDDGEEIRPRDGGADRHAERSADALELDGKEERVRLQHRKICASERQLMAGIDGDDALLREDVIESTHQLIRVERIASIARQDRRLRRRDG